MNPDPVSTSLLRIVFAGTPDFSVPALQRLIDAGHQIIAVLTQPDRPAGRGRKLTASPVKQCALAAGIEVWQPISLRDPAVQRQLQALDADLMVVVAYGLILPPEVLDIFSTGLVGAESVGSGSLAGCWNIHASLLPRWRGAAPIQRAILADDKQTGVCIMQMEAGLDTGPVLKRRAIDIGADETAGQLHDRLAQLGADLLLETIADRAQLIPQVQPEQGVTYAEKLSKSEATLDWNRSAAQLSRQVRAFNPWPVASARIGDQTLRVWTAEAIDGSAPIGWIRRADADGIEVGTADGILRISEVQKSGGRRMAVADFLNSTSIKIGYADQDAAAVN